MLSTVDTTNHADYFSLLKDNLLLDPDNDSVTLGYLKRAAAVPGKKPRLGLV